LRIDARGRHYRDLNREVREAVRRGEEEIILDGVNGQRYIGSGLKSDTQIIIRGVPGNDLAAFMRGPTIRVRSNAQDGVGNTMDEGKVVIDGDAGDIVGYAMRGGRIYVRGNVGYRAGIHMKSFNEKYPIIVVGASAGDFFGEYMAGGIMVVLGMENQNSPVGNYVGTGMHGGVIYIRGRVDPDQVGKEVGLCVANQEDLKRLTPLLEEYCLDFEFSMDEIMRRRFQKLTPQSSRPYGRLYAY
jgi:glutamate synthase domain-containing protein 3